MWAAWGVAWGDSWGTSWGPLHDVEEPKGWDTSQGKAGKNPSAKDYLSENLLRQQKARDLKSRDEYNLTRLHIDDQRVTELILSLVTEGFFDGDF